MKKNEKLERKRLTVEIPIDLFTDIKVRSAYKNCTATKWVIRAIISQLKKENEFNDSDV